MKIGLTKIKDLTEGVNFFWQMIVVLFFGALVFLFVASLVFWLNLEEDLSSITIKQTEAKTNFDHKDIDKILTKIENRTRDLASTTSDLPIIIDPSL